MNTNNKTVREKAMYYWNQQISEFGQYTLTSTHYPDRHPLSLTGREIEKIYLSEHPEENEETKFSKHWWNGLNYRTRIELADADTDNSGSVDAALMMDDETIERIYQSEHPKEQTKGVIERNDEALQVLIKELEKSDVRKYTCINQSGYSQLERDIVTALFAHYHDTHYIPLLELCGELHLLLFDLVLWSKQVQGRVSISTSEEKLQEIKSAIEKAKQLLKQ